MHCYANPLIKIKSHLRLLSIMGLLMCMAYCCQAKKYYFSSSTGNDSYSSTQAQNAATPWATISKLNTIFSTLTAGDSIFFKCGDVFYGSITINASGANGRPIVLAAYGSGSAPVISGFTTLTAWSADAAGVYKATLTNGSASLNMVTINGEPQALGRYPNRDAANGGYLKYESTRDTLGTMSIKDNDLTGATNWAGAEAVIRKSLWILDRCKITSHTGNTLYYTNTNGSDYTGTANFGYFIQNDARTLDQQGEWYYDIATRQLKIYAGAALPANYVVKAATLDALVNIRLRNYITFMNLAFEGANVYGIYATSSDFVTINKCSFTNIGGTAIYMDATSDINIKSVSTYNILSNAIRLVCQNDSNVSITNCSIRKTAALRGMGQSNGYSYEGILVDLNTNLLIENNRVDSTGYVAINFDGSNVLVRNNVVNNFCFNKDDAGGIYSWAPQSQNDGRFYYTNRIVKNNIVMNGIGAPDGRPTTAPFCSGIYLDGTIMNILVEGNTIFNMPKNGIHCNNPTNISIIGNTSFNNLNAVSFMRWPWAEISNLQIKRNIFYPKTVTQRNLYYTNAALNEPEETSLESVLQSLGSIDSNYYSRSNPVGFNYEVYTTSGGTLIPLSPHSMEGWESFSSYDTHSKPPFREAPTYKLRNTIGSNGFSNGSFSSNINDVTEYSSNNNAAISWDNTNRVSGGSLKLVITNPVPNRYVLLYGTVGAVSNTKKYVLRFKTLGTTAFGIVRAYIRKTSSPYTALIAKQVKVFGATVQQHEFLFDAPATESNASFLIEVEQNSGTVYLDNIEFYEADADVYNIDDYLRFEYNSNAVAQTISLGAPYIDVEGNYYASSITLAPFSSKILVKDTSILRQSLAVQAIALPVKCFGTGTTVTVSATGGIPPYRGTGVLNAVAGTYTYTVTDLRGVAASATVTITQPAAILNATATTGTITNFGGFTWVNIAATGGTPPYTGAVNYTNVLAGPHTYSVKDANGCFDTVNVLLTQPPLFPLQAFVTALPIKCNGGGANITVTATGGVQPYIGTGIYNYTAGTYRFKVRDAAGSVAYASVQLTQPPALQVSATAGAINVSSGTASVTVTATGGTAPYSGTGVFNNVSAGTYTYLVTDANGCSSSKTVTIAPEARVMARAAVPSQDFKVVVFPNPSTAAFDVWLQGNASEQAIVQVAAADGKIVYTAQGRQQHFIFGENLTAGIYLVKVSQAGNTKIVKVLKNR